MTKQEAVKHIIWQIETIKSELKTLKTQAYIDTYNFEIAVKEEVVRALKEQLTAQAEWIEDEDGDGRYCSNCMSDYCYLFEQAKRYKFCPNCGAKMKVK